MKQIPVIPFGNKHLHREKPNSFFWQFFEDRNQKDASTEGTGKDSIKDKESTPLYQEIASIWVSTEVDYNVPNNDKLINIEFDNMGTVQRRRYRKKQEIFFNKK